MNLGGDLLEAAQKDKMEGFARGPTKGTELFLLTLFGICDLMIKEVDRERRVTRFQCYVLTRLRDCAFG